MPNRILRTSPPGKWRGRFVKRAAIQSYSVSETGHAVPGMGLFYTVFHAGVLIGPFLGGGYASWKGTAASAFDFGAIVLAFCPIALVILRWREHGSRVSVAKR